MWYIGTHEIEKVQTLPSGPLGWINCTRQDPLSMEKYLNPKQLRICPRSVQHTVYSAVKNKYYAKVSVDNSVCEMQVM